MRKLLFNLLSTDTKAGLLALAFMLFLGLKVFALFVVAYVAIDRSFRSAAIVTAFMLIPTLCFLVMGHPWGFFLLVLSLTFLACSIHLLIRYAGQVNALLMPLTLLAFCFVLLGFGSDTFGWPHFWLTEFAPAMKAYMTGYGLDLPKETLQLFQSIEMGRIFWGVFVSTQLVLAVFCTACAARFQALSPCRDNSQARSVFLDMRSVRLSKWYLLSSVALGAACFFWKPMCFYVFLPVFLAPYLIAGVSLMSHAGWLRQLVRGLLLMLLFAFLGVLLAPLLAAIASWLVALFFIGMVVLGLLDTIMNCRSFSCFNRQSKTA